MLSLSFGAVYAQHSAAPQRATVVFYNLENLFDTINQENNDEELLPEKVNRWAPERYQHKLRNTSHVISLTGGNGLVIIGVVEIENRGVFEDLIAQRSLRDRHYDIVHYDPPDLRGIGCVILYQPDVYKVSASGARVVVIPSEPWIKMRDVVYVLGFIDGEVVHVLVGHWPLRGGGEAVSLNRRMAAAKTMRSMADSFYMLFPESKVVMMGDFNDDPISPSIRGGLGIQKGPDGLKASDYYIPMLQLYDKDMGTLVYRDVWNLFDIIVVNGELIGGNPTIWQLYRDPETIDTGSIFKQPFMIQQSGQYKGYTLRAFVGRRWQGGYSDHSPIYAYLAEGVVAKQLHTSVAIDLTQSPVA